MDKFLEKEKLVLIKYLLKTIRYGFQEVITMNLQYFQLNLLILTQNKFKSLKTIGEILFKKEFMIIHYLNIFYDIANIKMIFCKLKSL